MNRWKICAVMMILTSSKVFGQTDCANVLYDANKLYQKGQFSACISSLQNCKDQLKKKSEKFEASHLLALSYLALSQTEQAKLNIVELLRNNPEYQKFPNVDPLEFSRLLNSYRVEPRWYFGLNSGINRSSVVLDKSYSTYSSTQRYLPSTGYQLGISSDYRILRKLSLNADWMFSGLDIIHEIDNAGGWKQRYKENQQYTGVMAGLNYHLMKDLKFGGHLGGGFMMNYLYETTVFLESERIETKARLQSTQNPISMRNKWQPGVFVETGIEFWVLKGFLTLDCQYQHAFRNTVNPEERMKDMEFIYINHYVNDDVSIRQLNLLVGFKFPLTWRITQKEQP